MIQKFIHTVLAPRHFWRTVGFDELSEIYTSQLLRALGMGLIGIFVPIYLFKLGYSITAICVMFLAWFLFRPLWAYVSARIIARYGPKHAIAVSVLLQILYLLLLMTIESAAWPLWMVGIVGSFAYGLYLMAFQVDFSKIKHSEHGGKELGYVQIFERIGAVLGPLVGGIVASLFDPRYTIAIAIAVLCASLVPIFLSAEPTKRHQQVTLAGFPWRRLRSNMRVSAAFTLENIVSLTIWPLFLGVYVLSQNTYATLGFLTAFSTAVALIAVYAIGKLIDDQKGKKLLTIGAIGNGLLHLLRPFVTGVPQALAVSLANEPLTAMYRMPFLKGRFDESDSVPGYRIAYFMVIEFYVSVAAIVFWLVLLLGLYLAGDKLALQLCFVAGAIMSFIITRQKFAALQ